MRLTSKGLNVGRFENESIKMKNKLQIGFMANSKPKKTCNLFIIKIKSIKVKHTKNLNTNQQLSTQIKKTRA